MSKENNAADFADIQGIFRFAHGQLEEACFLFLSIEDSPEAKR